MTAKFRLMATMALLLALSVGLVSAAPGYVTRGTANTGIRVQNVGNATSTVQVDYYHVDNTTLNAQRVLQIEPRFAGSFAPGLAGIQSNWVGAAVASADQEIAAIAGLAWRDGGYRNDGMAGAAYSGEGAPGKFFYLPYFSKSDGDVSTFTIQNASSQTANVTIKFFRRSDGSQITAATQTIQVQPNLQKTVDLQQIADAALPKGTAGGATIESDQPVAAVVTNYNGVDVDMYNGVATGDNVLYYPRTIQWKIDGTCREGIGLTVQNVGTAEAPVTFEFYNRNDGSMTTTFNDTILPGRSKSYNTCIGIDMPQANVDELTAAATNNVWSGSVKVISNNNVPIAGISRWLANAKSFTTSYNAVGNGSGELFFPYFFRQLSSTGWQAESGLGIQNIGSNDVTVHLEVLGLDGTVAYETDAVIPANSSKFFNSRFRSNWPDYDAMAAAVGTSFDGSVRATITSGSGPIIGTALYNVGDDKLSSEYNAYAK